MERLKTSNVSISKMISNGSKTYPIGKTIYAVNLPFKLLRATVENADTGNLQSLHTLFDTYSNHMLANLNQQKF